MADYSAYEIAGFAGVAFYLGSYAALQFGWIKGSGYTYPILNTELKRKLMTSNTSLSRNQPAVTQLQAG